MWYAEKPTKQSPEDGGPEIDIPILRQALEVDFTFYYILGVFSCTFFSQTLYL